MKRSISILGVLTLACGMAVAPAAHADDYPSKPARIVSPFSAGGTNDLLARLSAKILNDAFGSPFVVEQRLGAGGIIGSDAVAKAAPDGYTLLLGSLSTHGIAPFVYEKLPFDYRQDFTPITIVANVPLVLVVNPQVPVQDATSLVQLLKDKPGGYTYGTAGNGTIPHLAGELFRHVTGTDIVHVPYRGDANAVNDLLGGQIDMMITNLPSVIGHIKAGKLRALAVSSAQRSESLPQVPTAAEAGVAGYEVNAWYALFGPGGMDPAVTKKLAAALAEGLRTPAAGETLLAQGAEAVGNTPDEFAAILRAEQEKWSAVIKQAGISIQ